MSTRNCENLDFRFLIESNNLRYRDVAERIGISGITFSRWMCEKMNDPIRRMRTEKAINEMIEKKTRRRR